MVRPCTFNKLVELTFFERGLSTAAMVVHSLADTRDAPSTRILRPSRVAHVMGCYEMPRINFVSRSLL